MNIFSGNANPELAEEISRQLHIPLSKAEVGRFSDGEIRVEILENVRGHDVFIIQSTCAPTSDNLLELLIMADALHRASAKRITAVMPYFGFARQDRRIRSRRVPITAKMVANMIDAVGVDRVLTVDLHADQIQGFFDIPVDNVYSTPIMLDDIRNQAFDHIMVVSPDVGGVVRARAATKHLPNSELAIIDKRRPSPNEAMVMHVIGEVEGCDCIIVDDIVDTAGTLQKAVDALKERGARKVVAYITHPVLSGNAIENIENSKLDELIVTDSIPLNKLAKECKKIRPLSLSKMLAQAIRRINEADYSISSMFI
ncbi:MAG: ribose-phosphate pyrophosphokinase [Gammaproteobacteria bacterium]|nr:ribose-phosphate pyrophosphokinase [Gammaproteobacteria bacterium]